MIPSFSFMLIKRCKMHSLVCHGLGPVIFLSLEQTMLPVLFGGLYFIKGGGSKKTLDMCVIDYWLRLGWVLVPACTDFFSI